MRTLKAVFLILLIGSLAWSEHSSAEILSADADGWHTWQINEAAPVARMCCFSWKRGTRSQGGCDLDGHNIGFTNDGDCAAPIGLVQVYVNMKHGEPVDIRVLSSECPVSTATEITDHGLVSTDENLAWFRGVIENPRQDMDVREDALFGLVQSGSDSAFDYLDALLAER
jgi:hypothetical protein